MRLSSWLAILSLLLPLGLRAQDAGADAAAPVDAAVEDASSSGCGTLSYQGRCDGDRVEYCAGGELRSVDCANPAEYPRGGPWVTCGLLDCMDPGCQGSWCVAKPGSPCGELSCDVAQDLGCLDGVCAASSPCDPDSYARSCDGAVLDFCRHTVSNHDCSQGGTAPYDCLLQGESIEPCVGLEGAHCDDMLGQLCRDGLICSGGSCVQDPDRDAGPLATDAADAAVDDRGGGRDRGAVDAGSGEQPICGCVAPGSAVAGWLALLPLALRRRRRSV